MAAGMQGNTVLLACRDPADPFIGTLKLHFESQAWLAREITSPEGAKIAAASGHVALVIVDSTFLRADELVGLLKARLHLRPAAVLRVIGSRAAAEPVKFAFLADEVMRAPCEVSEILLTAKALLSRAQRAASSGRSEVSFAFGPEPANCERAYEACARLLSEQELADDAQVGLATAFREAVGASLRPASRGTAPGPLFARVAVEAGDVSVRLAAPGVEIWPRGDAAARAALANAAAGGFGGSIATAADAKASALAYSLALIQRSASKVAFSETGDSITFSARLRSGGERP